MGEESRKKRTMAIILMLAMVVSLLPMATPSASATGGEPAVYTVSGTVLAGTTGASVSGIGVTLYDSTNSATAYTATTVSDGTYSIASVPAGTYTAVIAASIGSYAESSTAAFTVSSDNVTGADITLAAESTGNWLDDPSYYSTNWYDANPAATEFVVSTAADLAGMAYLVNIGTDTFAGDTITLADSVNITAHEWTPIGTESSPFSGIFDGSDKTVSGLYIDESSVDCQGLFGYLDSGTVKDLTVSGSVTGVNRVGAVAGQAMGAVIEDCVSLGTIHGSSRYVGGIAGMAIFTTIDGCANAAAVSADVGYSGGIVGSSLGDVINCSNSGAASTAGSYAGGISGQNAGNVMNCSNSGAVSTAGSYAGGISGQNAGNVMNCSNSGVVGSAGPYAGGIAGQNVGDVIDCYNSGVVSTVGSYAGGITGENYSAGDVINCSNSGAVSTVGSYAGGISGQNASAGNVKNSYNTGAVSGAYGGGLIGSNEGCVENCYDTGAVTGTDSGGVAGTSAYSGAVTSCYWLSESSSFCVGDPYGGAPLSGCGTFSPTGTITAGEAASCGSSQTLLYGTELLAALNQWVTVTNDAAYVEWISDSGNQNDGYPVFGTLHVQRVITAQPDTSNAYGVTATQAAGVGESYQWCIFTETDAEAILDLRYDAYGTALTNGRPHGFGLSDEDHEYTQGHSSWTLSDGVYSSGAQGVGHKYSAMSIPITVAEGEGISFEWKVSSEADSDYLSVGLVPYSDGRYALLSGTSVESISDETDWTEKVYSNLPSGSYHLVFVYTKDGANDDGDDCGYVRSIGTYRLLSGNTGAQLDRTGRTEGEQLRCNVTYDDGVFLLSDKTIFAPIAMITNNLTGVTSSNNAASIAINGNYSATLTPMNAGYSMSVTVTMGGTDITSSAYDSSTKSVSVADVTGDIVILATATAPSHHTDDDSDYTPPKTIAVTETSSSLFSDSASQIRAEANMNNAFSNSVEVKVTDTEETASGFSLGAGDEVYPFDISLYIKGTNVKTEPKGGYTVTFSLPVPDKLLDVKEQLSIVHKADDGTVATLESQLTQIDGVWYLVFEATEFSPYALVVKGTDPVDPGNDPEQPGSYDELVGLPYYLDDGGNEVFIGFAANGTCIAPSGVTVLCKENPKSFADIGSHWAKSNIDFVTERELFAGTGENRFGPNTGMTRAMFATVIGRLYERSYGEISAASDGSFTDVAYDDGYRKYVDWAAANNIIGGIGDGLFAPDREITRQEMASILYRFAYFLGVLPDAMDTVLSYPDANAIPSWAKGAALYCQSTGIITGRDGGNFIPQGTATRAEVAVILQRFVERAL